MAILRATAGAICKSLFDEVVPRLFFAVMLCVLSSPTAYCADSDSRFEDELAARGLMIGGAIGDLRDRGKFPIPLRARRVGARLSRVRDQIPSAQVGQFVAIEEGRVRAPPGREVVGIAGDSESRAALARRRARQRGARDARGNFRLEVSPA